jgi:hypothetical protein
VKRVLRDPLGQIAAVVIDTEDEYVVRKIERDQFGQIAGVVDVGADELAALEVGDVHYQIAATLWRDTAAAIPTNTVEHLTVTVEPLLIEGLDAVQIEQINTQLHRSLAARAERDLGFWRSHPAILSITFAKKESAHA